MENKAMQRHHNGQFLTTGTPSPLMQKVMENILRQQEQEKQYRDAVRAGRIQPNWGTFNISDRD